MRSSAVASPTAVRRSLEVLHGPPLGVTPLFGDQFLVRSGFDDPSLLHHVNLIGEHRGGEAMSDQDSCPVKATMGRLSRLGIRRNGRVAIVLPNGPGMAVTFLAVSSMATSAPLNPAYSFDEFTSVP